MQPIRRNNHLYNGTPCPFDVQERMGSGDRETKRPRFVLIGKEGKTKRKEVRDERIDTKIPRFHGSTVSTIDRVQTQPAFMYFTNICISIIYIII